MSWPVAAVLFAGCGAWRGERTLDCRPAEDAGWPAAGAGSRMPLPAELRILHAARQLASGCRAFCVRSC